MADNFGTRAPGRLAAGGRFYATPGADVPANVVYMPAFSSSPLFGVPEYPVKAGELGAFATVGTFTFPRPDGWTSSPGKQVYYTPTSATAGTFTATPAAGSVLLGFEITANTPPGALAVLLTHPNRLEEGATS